MGERDSNLRRLRGVGGARRNPERSRGTSRFQMAEGEGFETPAPIERTQLTDFTISLSR